MKKFIITLVFLAGFFILFNLNLMPASGCKGIAFASQDPTVIPKACNSQAQEFEDACYGTKSGNVSYTKQIGALKKIKSCLKKEGYSEDKIKATLILIKQKANEK